MATGRAEFGRGDDNQPIYLDEVFCEGDEIALSQCHHQAVHDCSHYEDAGAICQGMTSSTLAFALS